MKPAEQLDLLSNASEVEEDRGIMARVIAFCALSRTNPGNRKEYGRRNDPYRFDTRNTLATHMPLGSATLKPMIWWTPCNSFHWREKTG